MGTDSFLSFGSATINLKPPGLKWVREKLASAKRLAPSGVTISTRPSKGLKLPSGKGISGARTKPHERSNASVTWRRSCILLGPNGPDQWLAATGLSTPLGFIASPLHRVVRHSAKAPSRLPRRSRLAVTIKTRASQDAPHTSKPFPDSPTTGAVQRSRATRLNCSNDSLRSRVDSG